MTHSSTARPFMDEQRAVRVAVDRTFPFEAFPWTRTVPTALVIRFPPALRAMVRIPSEPGATPLEKGATPGATLGGQHTTLGAVSAMKDQVRALKFVCQ
jgi:hypothetical protein